MLVRFQVEVIAHILKCLIVYSRVMVLDSDGSLQFLVRYSQVHDAGVIGAPLPRPPPVNAGAAEAGRTHVGSGGAPYAKTSAGAGSSRMQARTRTSRPRASSRRTTSVNLVEVRGNSKITKTWKGNNYLEGKRQSKGNTRHHSRILNKS